MTKPAASALTDAPIACVVATAPWASGTWVFWQNNDTGDATYGGDGDVFNGTATTLQTWVIPLAPTTPSPANSATVTGTPSVLDWADVTGATSYDVYLDNVFKANVTTSQYTPPTLTNANHTWQVKVKTLSCP